MTELLVYSFNVGEFAAFLKSPPSAIKATYRSKKQKPHVAQIRERMRWLERILAGRKAVDPVFEAELDWDDDAVLESQEYFDSYRWLCDSFMTPQPTGPSFVASSIVSFDFYGFTESLRRFPCPFPIPKVDDPSKVAGYIPNASLTNFRLLPIQVERLIQVMEFLREIDQAGKDVVDEYTNEDYQAMDEQFQELRAVVHHWLEVEGAIPPGSAIPKVSSKRVMRDANHRWLEKLKSMVPIPSREEIELAHADFSEVCTTNHESGKDFFGIIG